MLKKSANFVLGSSKSSTYPRGYASGFDSSAALLDELFEHPADRQAREVKRETKVGRRAEFGIRSSEHFSLQPSARLTFHFSPFTSNGLFPCR